MEFFEKWANILAIFKIEFLTHLQYVSLHKAAQRAGFGDVLPTIIKDLVISIIQKPQTRKKNIYELFRS